MNIDEHGGTRPPIEQDIRAGLKYGAAFCVLAVVMLFLAATDGSTDVPRTTAGVAAFLLVLLAYLVGGATGGAVYWLLRLMRPTLTGWLLTGFLIACVVYGTVGFTGVLSYYGGVNWLELETGREGWLFLPVITTIAGLASGVPVGVLCWLNDRFRSRSNRNAV